MAKTKVLGIGALIAVIVCSCAMALCLTGCSGQSLTVTETDSYITGNADGSMNLSGSCVVENNTNDAYEGIQLVASLQDTDDNELDSITLDGTYEIGAKETATFEFEQTITTEKDFDTVEIDIVEDSPTKK